MKIENNIITAEEGKFLRRISDQTEFGSEMHLGYTYYLHGELLEEPLLELPEHYEEVDIPEPEPEEETFGEAEIVEDPEE